MEKTKTTPHKSTLYKIKEPSMYNVIMHNDDVTTMEFVVMVLMRIFHKSHEDAETVMLKIHNEGSAVVGKYTKDIAQSKAVYTMILAKKNGFPLKVTIEQE